MEGHSDVEFMRLLADIQARVADLSERVQTQDAIIRQDLALIKQDVARLRELGPTYVTRTEFTPVQKVVYGGVGLLLVTIVVWVLASAGIKT
jgi:hypothetical protein